MIPAYPKISTIGQRHNANIFDGEVEVTEKMDGSQFSFGMIDGKLHVRSKGQMIDPAKSDKLFNKGVEFAIKASEEKWLPNGVVFHGETIHAPRHNKLTYTRTPKGHVMLYAIRDITNNTAAQWEEVAKWAYILGCEAAPLLYKGMVDGIAMLDKIMDAKSVLGGAKMEGVVVKRFESVIIGDDTLPFIQAKYVSSEFKEVAGLKITGRDRVLDLFEQYQTVPRWEKAVQHLREAGELEGSPRDIGKLMAELNRDVDGECGEEVAEELWQLFRKDFLKTVSRGFPEWYKDQLIARFTQENAA